MSITLGTDENGKDAAISFERVSCMPIGGAVRSGEVSRTFALIAALDQSEDVNLRIIDCKRSSQFSCFQDHAYAYVKMTDGLDLVVDEVQETYTALNARLRKFRKNGASGYWDSPDHAGMPLDCPISVDTCARSSKTASKGAAVSCCPARSLRRRRSPPI